MEAQNRHESKLDIKRHVLIRDNRASHTVVIVCKGWHVLSKYKEVCNSKMNSC